MSERISILTPNATDCPKVVVDNTLKKKEITAGPKVTLFSSDTALYNFQDGENLELISLGFFIPERFVLYACGPGVGQQSPAIITRLSAYKTVSMASINLTQFGNNGKIKIPFPNYETAMGVFVDGASEIGEKFYLQIEFPLANGLDAHYLSMINVPASLNGETMTIVPWVKILHNFPMEA